MFGLFACTDSSPGAEGGALFRTHCAACHGVSGKGDGPVANSLSPKPSDLTRIAERNEGRFEDSKVLSAIDGRYEVAAHGSREMPVWGTVFLDAHRDDALPHHRGMDDARALLEFLQALQVERAAGGDEP